MNKPLPGYPVLRVLAETAFNMGLLDGMARSNPRSSRKIMDQLYQAFPLMWEEYSWKVFHRYKLRQVYGAGFDMARMHQTIAAPQRSNP